MAGNKTNETFNFELVSPEQKLMSREVAKVVIPGEEGDFGVLANHASLVATVRPGIVLVYEQMDSAPMKIFVAGGFADVSAANCTLLAEEAAPVEDLNQSELQAQLTELNNTIEKTEDKGDKARLYKQQQIVTAKLDAISSPQAQVA